MLVILGFIIAFACVFGTYVLHGGNIGVVAKALPFEMLTIGGAALGAFIGAFVFEFMKLYAAALLTGAWQLVMGLVLLAMVFLAPTGVFGMIERRLRPGRSA